jgi:hypothetical protein
MTPMEDQPLPTRPTLLIFDLDHPPALFFLRSLLTQIGIDSEYRKLSSRDAGRFLMMYVNPGEERQDMRIKDPEDLQRAIKVAKHAATVAGVGHIDIKYNVSPDIRPLIEALCEVVTPTSSA